MLPCPAASVKSTLDVHPLAETDVNITSGFNVGGAAGEAAVVVAASRLRFVRFGC